MPRYPDEMLDKSYQATAMSSADRDRLRAEARMLARGGLGGQWSGSGKTPLVRLQPSQAPKPVRTVNPRKKPQKRVRPVLVRPAEGAVDVPEGERCEYVRGLVHSVNMTA